MISARTEELLSDQVEQEKETQFFQDKFKVLSDREIIFEVLRIDREIFVRQFNLWKQQFTNKEDCKESAVFWRTFLQARAKAIRDAEWLHYTNNTCLIVNRCCAEIAKICGQILNTSSHLLLMPFLMNDTSHITGTRLDDCALTDIVLSDDRTTYVEVLPCLSFAYEDGFLRHTNMMEDNKPKLLSPSEAMRVVRHDSEVESLHNVVQKCVEVIHTSGTLFGCLNRLTKGLRGGGTSTYGYEVEQDAQAIANIAILDFAKVYDNLKPNVRERLNGLTATQDGHPFMYFWNILAYKQEVRIESIRGDKAMKRRERFVQLSNAHAALETCVEINATHIENIVKANDVVLQKMYTMEGIEDGVTVEDWLARRQQQEERTEATRAKISHHFYLDCIPADSYQLEHMNLFMCYVFSTLNLQTLADMEFIINQYSGDFICFLFDKLQRDIERHEIEPLFTKSKYLYLLGFMHPVDGNLILQDYFTQLLQLIRHEFQVQCQDETSVSELAYRLFMRPETLASQTMICFLLASDKLDLHYRAPGQPLTLMDLIVARNHPEMMRRVLLHADVNKVFVNGEPLLHHLIKRRSPVSEKVMMLGADLTALDAEGNTPLMVACQYNDKQMVNVILRFLARANKLKQLSACNHAGKSTLNIAVEHADSAICETLLSHLPIDSAEANRAAFCAALHAQKTHLVLHLLMVNKQKPFLDAAYLNSLHIHDMSLVGFCYFSMPACLAGILELGVDVNAPVNALGDTVPMLAAKNRKDEMLIQLVNAGADITKTNSEHMNVITCVYQQCRFHANGYRTIPEIFEKFAASGTRACSLLLDQVHIHILRQYMLHRRVEINRSIHALLSMFHVRTDLFKCYKASLAVIKILDRHRQYYVSNPYELSINEGWGLEKYERQLREGELGDIMKLIMALDYGVRHAPGQSALPGLRAAR